MVYYSPSTYSTTNRDFHTYFDIHLLAITTAFNLIFIIPLAASLTGAFGFASLGIRLAALIMSSRVH